MTTAKSLPRSAWISILIFLSGFSLLLLLLLVFNNPPASRITPQNVHLLHEVLRLDSGESGYPPYGFSLSPDNNTLLVTSGYTNEIWQLNQGSKRIMNLFDAGGVTQLLFFEGDQPMASFYNWVNSISFLNLNNGQPSQHFDGIDANILYSDWNISPDNRWFVITRKESALTMADIITGEVRFSISPPTGFVFRHINPVFSPDGSLLATSLIRDTPFGFDIFVWNTVTGKLLKHLGAFEQGTVDSLAFSHDGKLLAVGGGIFTNERKTSIIQLWDLESGQKLATWYGNGLSTQHLLFTPDNQTLLASGYGGVWLWNIPVALKTGIPQLYLHDDGNGADYDTTALSHDGALLAVSTPNSDIGLYEVKTSALLATLSGHQNRINQMAFSDDDQFLISSSSDNTVRFWSVGSSPYPAFADAQIDKGMLPAPLMTPTLPG